MKKLIASIVAVTVVAVSVGTYLYVTKPQEHESPSLPPSMSGTVKSGLTGFISADFDKYKLMGFEDADKANYENKKNEDGTYIHELDRTAKNAGQYYLVANKDMTIHDVIESINPTAQSFVVSYWNPDTAQDNAFKGYFILTPNNFYNIGSGRRAIGKVIDASLFKGNIGYLNNKNESKYIIPAGRVFIVMALGKEVEPERRAATQTPTIAKTEILNAYGTEDFKKITAQYDICSYKEEGWHNFAATDKVINNMKKCKDRIKSIYIKTGTEKEKINFVETSLDKLKKGIVWVELSAKKTTQTNLSKICKSGEVVKNGKCVTMVASGDITNTENNTELAKDPVLNTGESILVNTKMVKCSTKGIPLDEKAIIKEVEVTRQNGNSEWSTPDQCDTFKIQKQIPCDTTSISSDEKAIVEDVTVTRETNDDKAWSKPTACKTWVYKKKEQCDSRAFEQWENYIDKQVTVTRENKDDTFSNPAPCEKVTTKICFTNEPFSGDTESFEAGKQVCAKTSENEILEIEYLVGNEFWGDRNGTLVYTQPEADAFKGGDPNSAKVVCEPGAIRDNNGTCTFTDNECQVVFGPMSRVDRTGTGCLCSEENTTDNGKCVDLNNYVKLNTNPAVIQSFPTGDIVEANSKDYVKLNNKICDNKIKDFNTIISTESRKKFLDYYIPNCEPEAVVITTQKITELHNKYIKWNDVPNETNMYFINGKIASIDIDNTKYMIYDLRKLGVIGRVIVGEDNGLAAGIPSTDITKKVLNNFCNQTKPDNINDSDFLYKDNLGKWLKQSYGKSGNQWITKSFCSINLK